ncbi:MAG TPA: tetratricopeptide repeat protein [Chthoniobacterales bacterium]|jgi:TolA-binding protein|nr:tetratricopeptide repeat protein [Chthoniobacterales bacterium]
MPTALPPSRDAALEARVFWIRFKNEIAAVLVVVLLAIIGFTGYRFYSDRRDSAASALLSSAKNASDFQQVISRYPTTPAGAAAYLLLAEAQRNEKKFIEANATLQAFINKNPNHELATSARMAMAANLESMGKTDEALSMYQRIAASYPKSFNAPLALYSQVHLLKAKNQSEEARRVCEAILTQYRDSFWAGEAARALRSLKPAGPPRPAANPAIPPFLAAPPPTPAKPGPSNPKPRR